MAAVGLRREGHEVTVSESDLPDTKAVGIRHD